MNPIMHLCAEREQGCAPMDLWTAGNPNRRTAIVTGARTEREVAAYLPENYRVIPGIGGKVDGRPFWIIGGTDHAGWTLDYVKGRCASGLIWVDETT